MRKHILSVLAALLVTVLISGCSFGGSSGGNDQISTTTKSAGTETKEDSTPYDTGVFRGVAPAGWTYVPAVDIFSEDNAPDPESAVIYKGYESEADTLRCASVSIFWNKKGTTILDSRNLYENVEEKTFEINGRTWEGYTGDFSDYHNFNFVCEDTGCVWQINGLLNGSKSQFSLDDQDFKDILAGLDYYSAENTGTDEKSSSASADSKATPVPKVTKEPETTETPTQTPHPSASPTPSPQGEGSVTPAPTDEPTPSPTEEPAPTEAPHEHTLTAYPYEQQKCNADGHWTYYVCSECGAVLDYQYNPTTIEAEIIPADSITHDLRDDGYTAPTCTAAGHQDYICWNCGMTASEEIPALGHDFQRTGGDIATCSTPGHKVYNCSRCGEEYVEEIPAMGQDAPLEAHTYVVENIYSDEDHHVTYCHDCGRVFSEEYHVLLYYPKAGEESMYHVSYCDICNTEVNTGLTHVMVDGTCVYCGYTGAVG